MNKWLIPVTLLAFAIPFYNFEEVCDDNTKSGLAIIFCENAMKCANQSGYDLMEHMRTCMSKVNPDAKKIIEDSNKLGATQCVKEVSNHVCKVLDEIKQEPNKYKECTDRFNAEEAVLKTCEANDKTS